jgi:hypothetical protein
MNPWATYVVTTLVSLPNITTSSGLVTRLSAYPASVVGPRALRATQHNGIRWFGGPEPTPRAVVAPACRRSALASPEVQPPLHVCFGNPHALMSGVLREGDDVRHPFDDSAVSA